MSAPDVIVIGGGLHGSSTALHLAMAGAKVTVLEKDHAGRNASGVNAGGVRRLGRDLREIPLALESLKIWQRISDLVDDDCDFAAKGQVQVAETDEELATQRRRVTELQALGFDHEKIIDRKQLREIVPAVSEHCIGGIHVAGDGAAMPYRTTFAFRRKAVSLGVQWHDGTAAGRVTQDSGNWRVETEDGQTHTADAVVNCSGAWSDRLCRDLGEPVPLTPIAPMLMITSRMPHFIDPVVGAAGRVLSFKQFDNGTVLIGGGLTGVVDLKRNRAELDVEKLTTNARSACAVFPHMRKARVVRAWAGIEAEMRDRIPVIGPSSRHERLFHAFGFSAHGFQLGPFVGKLMAELVLERAPPVDIAPFRIDRFGHERPSGPDPA